MALSIEEKVLIEDLTKQLSNYRLINQNKDIYYESKNTLKNLKIALPKALSGLRTSVAWANICVEALNERINFNGVTAPEGVDVDSIIKANNLDLEADLAHRDALIYGTSYALAGYGDVSVGEPEILITIESPNSTIGVHNPRTRRLDALLKVTYDREGRYEYGSLILANETIYFQYSDYSSSTGGLVDYLKELPDSRDVHNIGFIPAVRFINKRRASDLTGKSEITRSIIDFTDKAVRTFTNAEVASEFYAAPQKYLLNIDLSQFKDKDDQAIDSWDAYMGKMLLSGPAKAGAGQPLVGQFQANSPEPYMKLIEAYTREIVKETGIPSGTLGLTNGNPASAEAIIKEEVRLIKRAEDRAKTFGAAWTELLRYALILRDGSLPEGAEFMRAEFMDPATPTKSADADAAFKLVSKDILLPDSEVTYNRLNFTEAEKVQIRAEKKAKAQEEALGNIRLAAAAARVNDERLQAASETK
jgi:hypothetical protein